MSCSMTLRRFAAKTSRITTLTTPKRPFSTTANAHQNTKRTKAAAVVVVATVTSAGAAIYYARHIRHEKLSTLISAKDSGLLSQHNDNNQSASTEKYDLQSIIETIKRSGLMGSTSSVKEELDLLRKYHLDKGYNGGLVVRDLSLPLFTYYKSSSSSESSEESSGSDKNMAQRECYYLYYEIKANGHKQQQIFCRGTTLLADVLTCLQSVYMFDEELECHVHHGFNKHADRVIEDVLPLLTPPGDSISTVEVAGHSLGGAVAMLVAAKLKKRGYNITCVLAVAGPRLCRGYEDRKVFEKYLPIHTIRIENDFDLVPYLPPSGVSAGDKLWLVSDEGIEKAFLLLKDWIDEPSNEWAESVLLNCVTKIFSIIMNQNQSHRIATHVAKLNKLAEEQNDTINEANECASTKAE